MWSAWRCDPITTACAWWDTHTGENLRAFFALFLDAWTDPARHDIVRHFAHYVVEANRSCMTLESRIMPAGAALEYLSWTRFVGGGLRSAWRHRQQSASENSASSPGRRASRRPSRPTCRSSPGCSCRPTAGKTAPPRLPGSGTALSDPARPAGVGALCRPSCRPGNLRCSAPSCSCSVRSATRACTRPGSRWAAGSTTAGRFPGLGGTSEGRLAGLGWSGAPTPTSRMWSGNGTCKSVSVTAMLAL